MSNVKNYVYTFEDLKWDNFLFISKINIYIYGNIYGNIVKKNRIILGSQKRFIYYVK